MYTENGEINVIATSAPSRWAQARMELDPNAYRVTETVQESSNPGIGTATLISIDNGTGTAHLTKDEALALAQFWLDKPRTTDVAVTRSKSDQRDNGRTRYTIGTEATLEVAEPNKNEGRTAYLRARSNTITFSETAMQAISQAILDRYTAKAAETTAEAAAHTDSAAPVVDPADYKGFPDTGAKTHVPPTLDEIKKVWAAEMEGNGRKPKPNGHAAGNGNAASAPQR